MTDKAHLERSPSPTQSVWLAEGQSSQRDMLASLQRLKPQASKPFAVIASHRHDRPEIFEFADVVYCEPSSQAPNSQAPSDQAPSYQTPSDSVADAYADATPKIPHTAMSSRCEYVLRHAQQHQVRVLLTGRNSIDYERHRATFAQAGIRLLTGASSTQALATIDDKFAFMQHCHAHNIPVAEAWRFETIDELTALLDAHSGQSLCVKPVTGIFAQGFWRLDTHRPSDDPYDSFEHLYYTEEKKINTEQFISAYAHSHMVQARPIPMLLMPYLSGKEYSIDVVCEQGRVLAAVTRYKTGKIQHIGYEQAVMDVVIPTIAAFGCDGIVSVQTKQDSEGQHKILEINSRPSGGIGYTTHSGIDLTQVGFGYWLGLTDKPQLADIVSQIVPCQVRSVMVSVKL